MKHNFLLACAGALLAAAPAMDAYAQSNTSIQFVKTKGDTDSLLKAVRPVEPNAIPVPKFAIKTADNSFVMTVGGQINPIMGWDIGNNLYAQGDLGGGINFTTQAIPVPAVRGHKGDFYINALNSNIDFTVIGLANSKNAITGYMKLGTNGVSSQLKLKKAYVTWRGLTAGLKTTLLQDGLACQPPTIDPEGPSGEVGGNVYEVNYTSPVKDGFRAAIALDVPTFDSSNGVYRGKDYPTFVGTQVASFGDVEQMIPDIPMWVEYAKDDNNRIRLSGIVRSFQYRDLINDKRRTNVGWGIQLSGNYQPVEPLVISLQAIYGKGIGNYIQDLAGLPYSFYPKSSAVGHMTCAPMMGIDLGFTINATDRLQFNIMGSEARIWKVEPYANALGETQNYRYALYGCANCFYSFSAYLQWGIEYLIGRRETWNIGGANDHRIQTSLCFTI